MALSKELQIGKAGEHFVCFDLIKSGYNAFLADQGLPYDVILEYFGCLYKVQVRSTQNPIILKRVRRSSKSNARWEFSELIYRFYLSNGKGGIRRIIPNDVDLFAFVGMDCKKVAYMPSIQIMNKDGCLKRLVEIRNEDTTLNRQLKVRGRMFDKLDIETCMKEVRNGRRE